jgi:hypothetical protein
MQPQTFFDRFPETTEIGRDITDEEVRVYYDNGSHVGEARQHRGTTVTTYDVLFPADADCARDWFRRKR